MQRTHAEQMSQPAPAPVLLSVFRQEQPHFKAAQPGIPSRQRRNLQADTKHTLGPTQVG